MDKSGVYNINDLIRADKERGYQKDYERIKNGKKYNKHFDDYTEEYIKEMIMYFESKEEYDKSGYFKFENKWLWWTFVITLQEVKMVRY
jgi:hypothetical protein